MQRPGYGTSAAEGARPKRASPWRALAVVGLALGAALWLPTTPAVHAQGVTTAAVGGVVTSRGGQPLGNAQVTVRNASTGLTRTVLTNNSGRYFVPNLPPGGPYTVAVQSIGHSREERQGISLVLNQTTSVDFQLAEEAVAIEGVTVTASNNAVISPTRTGASTVVGAEEVGAIPTLERNFTDLAVVSPHVVATGASPSVGGANNRFNNIQIDGAVNNDVFGLASSGVPGGQANAKPIPITAIQQFQVLVAPFDVRQTGFTGGLINAVTRGGTNRFQGEVYGFFRNESLVRSGELTSGSESLAPISDFQRAQGGFWLGGPIVRDKLHFFVNAEYEHRDQPTELGIESDPAQLRVLPQRIREVSEAARRFGLDPGDAGAFSLENPVTNAFGRLDYTISERHRLALRHNYVAANDDDSPSRGGSRFELSSNTYLFRSRTNSTVLQLFSQLSPSVSNEFLTNVQRVRDRRAPEPQFRYSQIDVSTRDVIGGTSTRGTVRIGAEFFSQANELDQDIVEVTDNLTYSTGPHQLTFGVTGQYLRFRNVFFPGSLGFYRFDSPEAFSAGRPSAFEINLPFPGRDDPAARFSVFQPGAYAQDVWSVSDRLTLTLGVRADVPLLLDDPADNPDFSAAFNRSTSSVPSGNVLISPRFGFNWRSEGESPTQFRGGIGVFSGRPPYVWVSNAFGNTGRESVVLSCRGAETPRFEPLSPPRTCASGAGPRAAGAAIVNVFDPDFRYPQDLKLDLAIDRVLPLGITATLEGIFTKAVNQISVRELNLVGPQNVPATSTQGLGNRLIYGQPQVDRDFAFNPVRVDRRFRNVVEMTNSSEGYSYLLTAELRKTFLDRFTLRGAYTFMQVKDEQSLTSSIATSNYGFNPVGRSITDRPLTASVFERPHKVMLQTTAELLPRFGGTNVSLLYIGTSGSPYSYTYDGDVNGDGYEGPGLFGRNNDLIYVPADLNEVRFATPDDRRLFEQLIEQEECLQAARGQILERNSCRGPWSNRVDLSLVQGLPIGGRRNGPKLELTVFNLGNLLNEEWGLQEGPFNATVTALELRGRANSSDPNSAPVFSYDGATGSEGGATVARRPLNTFFSSRYQIQLGLRIGF